jgi:hypothetical protein
MLSLEQTKRLLGNEQLSDREAEEIRDISYRLAELLLDKWRLEQLSVRVKELDPPPTEDGG